MRAHRRGASSAHRLERRTCPTLRAESPLLEPGSGGRRDSRGSRRPRRVISLGARSVMPANRRRSQRQTTQPTQQKPFEPHARARSDDANAFLPDPEGGPARAPEELAESLAEEFVEAATSGEDRDEEVLDATFSEEMGGPFIETGPAEEMSASVDDMNPADADR